MSGSNYEDDRMEFHKPAPAADHTPRLYNKDCGATYRTCGKMTAETLEIITKLIKAEPFCVMTINCGIYRHRCNTITRKFAKQQIAAIFDQALVDYPIPMCELYRRYAIRVRAMTQSEANLIDWQAIPNDDPSYMRFREHIQDHGILKLKTRDVCLWRLFAEPAGPYYLIIQDNVFTKTLVQMINSMSDAVANLPADLCAAVNDRKYTVRDSYLSGSSDFPLGPHIDNGKFAKQSERAIGDINVTALVPNPPSNDPIHTQRLYGINNTGNKPVLAQSIDHKEINECKTSSNSQYGPSSSASASGSNRAPLKSIPASTRAPSKSIAASTRAPSKSIPPAASLQSTASKAVISETPKCQTDVRIYNKFRAQAPYSKRLRTGHEAFWNKWVEQHLHLLVAMDELVNYAKHEKFDNAAIACKQFIVRAEEIIKSGYQYEVDKVNYVAFCRYAEHLEELYKRAVVQSKFVKTPQTSQFDLLFAFFNQWVIEEKLKHYLFVIYDECNQDTITNRVHIPPAGGHSDPEYPEYSDESDEADMVVPVEDLQKDSALTITTASGIISTPLQTPNRPRHQSSNNTSTPNSNKATIKVSKGVNTTPSISGIGADAYPLPITYFHDVRGVDQENDEKNIAIQTTGVSSSRLASSSCRGSSSGSTHASGPSIIHGSSSGLARGSGSNSSHGSGSSSSHGSGSSSSHGSGSSLVHGSGLNLARGSSLAQGAGSSASPASASSLAYGSGSSPAHGSVRGSAHDDDLDGISYVEFGNASDMDLVMDTEEEFDLVD